MSRVSLIKARIIRMISLGRVFLRNWLRKDFFYQSESKFSVFPHCFVRGPFFLFPCALSWELELFFPWRVEPRNNWGHWITFLKVWFFFSSKTFFDCEIYLASHSIYYVNLPPSSQLDDYCLISPYFNYILV